MRDYKIIKMLGHGAFGITYLAQEDITDKRVVIKENYPTTVSFRDMTSLTVGPLTDNHKETYDWALTRFLDEAKTLSSLSHPNIVPIRHAFKALGTAYYVMPHVEGTDLHKAAPAPDNITAEWLLPVLEKILSALGYLHAQGLIHRDIKPNNILMNATGEPILIDFGTARALESTHSHTHIGTPGFMPFEQLSGKGKRGPWTDFYALGATCYYLITGKVPPHSVDRMEEDEYLPLAGNPSLANHFPEHVLSSIDKALRMNRSERWQSAQEWLESLKSIPSSQSGESSKNIQYQLTTSLKSTQLTTKPHTSSSKKKSYTLSLIFFLLLAALIYGGFYYNHQQPVNQPHTGISPAHPEVVNSTKQRDDVNPPLSGINPEQYNSELYAAARDGDVEKVRLLLEAGADVNWANEAENQNTPLIVAAENGHAECVRLLLAASGIDVNKANKNDETPLHWAENNNHSECADLIRAAGGKSRRAAILLEQMGISSEQYNSSLYAAARDGDVEKVRLLLEAGADVNWKNDAENGDTPLIWAAFNGHTECVKLLLNAPGININQANQQGSTPLIWAADKGHTECVRLLLAAPGININQANQSGATPLINAAFNGHKECVRLLLAAPGINIDQANQHGDTPLIWAAENGHTECVRLLLAAPGIDINKASSNGTTPLSAATGKGHTECANLIRAAGGR